jgi:hypothetical protein
MSDEIHIPDSLTHPKPWWTSKPNDERTKEILDFIYNSGAPHLWPGQTYDKPKRDAVIDYVSEFWLPSSKPLAPCPCCRPKHGKYRHGMIAYFPEEKIIRLLGHNCFGTINSDKHNEALKKYHAETRRKQNLAYLIGNLGIVPDLIKIVGDAIDVGHAVDNLRNQAVIVFKEVLHSNLYEHIKTGHLRITSIRTQHSNIPGQEDDERDVSITETYGSIAGQDMLRASYPKLGKRLEQSLQALSQIDFGADFKSRVQSMNDGERTQAAIIFGKALNSTQDTFRRTAPIHIGAHPFHAQRLGKAS